MKILIINFNLSGLDVDSFKSQAHIDALDFRGVEGLISKYFLGDEKDNLFFSSRNTSYAITISFNIF